MKKYSMKHKKKATRRILKGGFEFPNWQNWWNDVSWFPWNKSKSVSDDNTVADPSASLTGSAPLPGSAPLLGSASPTGSAPLPVSASPTGSAPLPGPGGKKHKKKRSLKRNTKKRN